MIKFLFATFKLKARNAEKFFLKENQSIILIKKKKKLENITYKNLEIGLSNEIKIYSLGNSL